VLQPCWGEPGPACGTAPPEFQNFVPNLNHRTEVSEIPYFSFEASGPLPCFWYTLEFQLLPLPLAVPGPRSVTYLPRGGNGVALLRLLANLAPPAQPVRLPFPINNTLHTPASSALFTSFNLAFPVSLPVCRSINSMAFAAKFAKKGLAMQIQVEEPEPAAVSFNVSDSGTFCTFEPLSLISMCVLQHLQAPAMAQSESRLTALPGCLPLSSYPTLTMCVSWDVVHAASSDACATALVTLTLR
jgi:hypothetical protein